MASSDPNLEKVYGSLNFSYILQLLILTLFRSPRIKLLLKIEKRELYKFIGQTQPASKEKKLANEVQCT